jgi:hypothetical protein
MYVRRSQRIGWWPEMALLRKVPRTISIRPDQDEWLKQRPTMKLSSRVQDWLDELMSHEGR